MSHTNLLDELNWELLVCKAFKQSSDRQACIDWYSSIHSKANRIAKSSPEYTGWPQKTERPVFENFENDSEF